MFNRLLQLLQRGGMAGLLGEKGTGKTQMAAEAIRAFAAEGKNAIYMRAQELFDTARDAYNKKISEKEAIRRLVKTNLLVIDECQDRSNSEYEHRVLTLISDIRYGAMLPTLYMANLDAQKMREQLGGSISSRIDEMGTIFMCSWPSFRKVQNG